MIGYQAIIKKEKRSMILGGHFKPSKTKRSLNKNIVTNQWIKWTINIPKWWHVESSTSLSFCFQILIDFTLVVNLIESLCVALACWD